MLFFDITVIYRSSTGYTRTITTNTGQEGVGSRQGLPRGKGEERGWWQEAVGGGSGVTFFSYVWSHFFHFVFHIFCKQLDFDSFVSKFVTVVSLCFHFFFSFFTFTVFPFSSHFGFFLGMEQNPKIRCC